MGMFGGDSELGNIPQEAVKQKVYETWPYFVQHTLFHGEKDDFKAWRQLAFPEKMKIAERLKEEGNELYSKGNFSDAVDKYEEAATLVYYCYSTDPDWRNNNQGIEDDMLVLVDDAGTTDEEANQQKRLRLTCCLNLAACKQKLGNYDEVITACDVALGLDPRSVKALYRRAEARVRPAKTTRYDQELAVKDLAKALEVDPTNQAVEKLLVKLRGQRRSQRDKAKMGMFGGDNELGNILQEAVKLKSAQMNEKRKLYETWPYFVQHTLFHGEKDDFKAWRQLPFPEKMKVSERLKEEGNELYSKGNFSDAVDKYEEAATLVYYCYSTDPGWRKNNRGIDDDVLVLVDDAGTTDEEAMQQKQLRLTCCLNLAACKQKLGNFDEVIMACDVALELDPRSVKALYRRAEARVRPTKATGYDHDLAIKDLAKAYEVDPTNQMVEKLLAKLRGERRVQREKDQGTFGGMFERGTIYDQSQLDAPAAFAPAGNADEAEMRDLQKRVDNISDEDSLEKRTADAELLRDLYMRNGKEEEARELNEKIQAAKKAIRERQRPSFDWENPTPEMIEDAKKWDLDLTDPLVLGELKRLEREGIDSLPPEAEAPPAADLPFDGGPPPLVDGPPVPWMRYVILFAAMVVGWQILDSGLLRWGPVWLWQRVVLRNFYGRAEEADATEERGGPLAVAYTRLASLFGATEVDDGDL